jgi:tRNA(fMet)-specific endonuclease VapC
MLDTDICSYIIKNRPDSVRLKFQKLSMESVCISIVTYAELMYGVEKSSSRKVNRSVIEHFISHLTVIAWGIEAADNYATVRTKLESKSSPIGAMDMMIAAHAKSLSAVLVTNNEKHFNKISGLPIENWA